jgi:holliday junction DNA helicase RuvB
VLDTEVSDEAAAIIARRSRGTPRIANRLLRRVRDVASVDRSSKIDGELAVRALDLFGIDERGLDKVDRRILSLLAGPFAGQPVGLVTLAHACGEEPTTIEDAYEPFLLREGLLVRTPRGRLATALAYRHLGLDAPPGALF